MATFKPLKWVAGKFKQFAAGDTIDPAFLPATMLAHFGDGSDGDVTISVNTTLTRTMYYDTLVVNAGIVLTTAGFKIYCKTSLQNLGTIGSVGNNGSLGGSGIVSSGGGGGTAATTFAIGEFLVPSAAGAGGAGGGVAPATGATGSASGNVNCLVSGSANRSGAGGAGDVGGGNGLGTASNIYRPVRHLTHNYQYGILLIGAGRAGSGGGGGGGSAAGGGGGGGGGGGAPHPVFIYAKRFDNQGIVRSNGGNGGNGGNAFGNGGGGGYGGGACGGVVILGYYTSVNLGTIQVLKGSNGTPGLKAGTGNNGAAAVVDATDGYYQLIDVSTGSNTIV